MEEIVKRITQILEEQQLSSSAFADTIGVQRSSISHVLSGRNKPSLEFILKTVRAFPAYSSDWLLFGKSSESPATYPTLSNETSSSVVQELTGSGKLNPKRMKAISYGETQPIESNNTSKGREKNRRIEIEINY